MEPASLFQPEPNYRRVLSTGFPIESSSTTCSYLYCQVSWCASCLLGSLWLWSGSSQQGFVFTIWILKSSYRRALLAESSGTYTDEVRRRKWEFLNECTVHQTFSKELRANVLLVAIIAKSLICSVIPALLGLLRLVKLSFEVLILMAFSWLEVITLLGLTLESSTSTTTFCPNSTVLPTSLSSYFSRKNSVALAKSSFTQVSLEGSTWRWPTRPWNFRATIPIAIAVDGLMLPREFLSLLSVRKKNDLLQDFGEG